MTKVGKPATARKPLRHVLMLLGCYQRLIHRGIARYAREHGWHLDARFAVDRFYPDGWAGDGILYHPADIQAFYPKLKALGVPIVCLGWMDYPAHPRVSSDKRRVGRLAARHFMERGFTQFALYQDLPEGEISPLEGYREELLAHDRKCLCIAAQKGEASSARIQRTGLILAKARHPVAVFARDDHSAAEVIDACLSAGLLVPEQVSVLGVNNDELVCEALRVPLSSIDCDLDGMGYEAAAQLDRLMSGEALGSYVTMIPPKEVITRQSTDILAYDNLELVKAVQFIRQNSQAGIGVMNVVAATGASKRKLSTLFQAMLGRSILQEITQHRLAHACRLLETTDLTVEAIAAEAGFPNRRRLHLTFLRGKGVTPRGSRTSVRR